jgi:hypothetical protein
VCNSVVDATKGDFHGVWWFNTILFVAGSR